MGSKNLKTIHITATRHPSTPPELRTAAKEAVDKLRVDPHLDSLRRWGTLVLMDSKHRRRPTGQEPPVRSGAVHQIGERRAFDKYVTRHHGCYACPIKCSRNSKVADGPYAVEMEGPEYETTNALGPMCWVSDPEAILYTNQLCNEYGLDTISTGVTIAFALKLREKGLLADEPDLPLAWGDPVSVYGLIERIALRRGIGDVLAEGTHRAAERIGGGAEHYARSRVSPKGLDWATPPPTAGPITSTACLRLTWPVYGTSPTASSRPRSCRS
ncbi:MAG: aldehyde ferredoxin oxidoreductase C-terminal domain-containing protein [Anaerolineae bacterium]